MFDNKSAQNILQSALSGQINESRLLTKWC
jgi:hypothetical protein